MTIDIYRFCKWLRSRYLNGFGQIASRGEQRIAKFGTSVGQLAWPERQDSVVLQTVQALMAMKPVTTGIDVQGLVSPAQAEILTPQALRFVAGLQRERS